MTLVLANGYRRIKGFTSRPQGSVVNPDHPLVRSNSLAWANFGSGFGSFTMRDESGYGNHGTLAGVTGTPTWSHAIGRPVLGFGSNANAQYVEVGNVPALHFNNGGVDIPWWLSLWFNPLSDSETCALICRASAGAVSEWSILYANTGALFQRCYQNSSVYVGQTTNLSYTNFGHWYHALFTYNGNGAFSGFAAYVNGVAVSTSTSSFGTYSGMISQAYPVEIGRRGTTANFFNGSLADIIVGKGSLYPVQAIPHLADPGNVMLDTGGCTLLLPPRRRSFASAGGGGPTFKAAWAVRRGRTIGAGVL